MGVLRVLEGCCRVFEVFWRVFGKIKQRYEISQTRLRNYFTKKNFTNDGFPYTCYSQNNYFQDYQIVLQRLLYWVEDEKSTLEMNLLVKGVDDEGVDDNHQEKGANHKAIKMNLQK